MNNFFAELKRRNVVRVGIAYAVVAWVIMQFLDVVAPLMGLPDVFQKGVLVLLAVGAPIALLLSWAYEVTPEGVMKTKEVDASKSITHGTGQKINKLIIAGLALVIAFFVYDKFIAATPINLDSGGAREASIAVLPFTDMSPAGDQQYFGDGIAEEILNVLAKNTDMKVAGRTSSFKFKGQNENLQLIAQQLNVDHILEGSVRKDGDKIRVTVQLIAADDGFHLWSETYDRNLVDIFAIQDEISQAVAEAMQVQLGTGGEVSSPQTIASAEAYSLYLQGMQYLHARGSENLEKAAKFLEVVTILDPGFDPAWAAMARAYGLLPTYQVASGPEVLINFEKGKTAALQALVINPQNAQAYSALNYINIYQLNWTEAEKNNLMATTLAPNDA
ncbi:MAG: tetratricopeptide repeat protein, partial [Alphaproteobacteria bacterium]